MWIFPIFAQKSYFWLKSGPKTPERAKNVESNIYEGGFGGFRSFLGGFGPNLGREYDFWAKIGKTYIFAQKVTEKHPKNCQNTPKIVSEGLETFSRTIFGEIWAQKCPKTPWNHPKSLYWDPMGSKNSSLDFTSVFWGVLSPKWPEINYLPIFQGATKISI